MKKLLHYIFLTITIVTTGGFAQSCIEDSISSSANDQPLFSVDTLKLGETFTEALAPTRRFTVYNKASKVISIGSISLRDDNDNRFRLNVDGMSGRSFSNVEIRPNDSIFVFVEMLPAPNGSDGPIEINAHLDFVTLGVTRSVVINALTQDIDRMKGEVITTDMTIGGDKPIQVFDSLVVAEGTTLRLAPGTRLLFHDKAWLIVRGTLLSEGTPDRNVSLTGDRTGNVASSIPYELMSGQWGGVYFTPSSRDNVMSFTSVRNSEEGVIADSISSRPGLVLKGCQLRNSKGYALTSWFSDIDAYSSEITDASAGVMALTGGNYIFNHCTIANYYLFSAFGGPAIQFGHVDDATDTGSAQPRLKAEFSNSIIYGLGSDLSHGDLTGTSVTLNRCLLGSNGTDDDNFINCIWGEDPLYLTDRPAYLFDYRFKAGSPAEHSGDASLMRPDAAVDRDGAVRNASAPSLGAHETGVSQD